MGIEVSDVGATLLHSNPDIIDSGEVFQMFRDSAVFLNGGTSESNYGHTRIIQGVERIDEVPGLYRFEVVCLYKLA